MRIQHNIMSMNAYRNYSNNASSLSKNLEKLSSGYRINRAGDDAAGLAISQKMRAQITGLDQAQSNAKSGINLVQTAEGALQEVHDMLNRMVQLADQSANGTYDNGVDRANLQKEVDQLKKEIDRIADGANFNGINLLDGSMFKGSTITFKIDATTASGAVDLVFNGGTFKNSTGADTEFSFVIAKASKASKVGAAMSKSGKITLTLEAGKDYTADDLNELIKNMAPITVNSKSNINDVVKNLTVGGAGISSKNSAGKDATNINTLGTVTSTKKHAGELTLQIGDTSKDFNKMTLQIRDMHAEALGLKNIDISTQDKAADSISAIKSAINMVSSLRGDLGATQNRLDHTINNLSVMTENIQDAESTIRDTDVAAEMMKYTKNNILVQSAQAMLAQANQVPQGVLQLLQ